MIQGREVVHEIVLDAPREAVFAMLVRPEELVRWIGISAELDPRPGGRFRFEVTPGQLCEGAYLVVEPPERVEVSWGWSDPGMGLAPGSSRVEIVLTDLGARTGLRLVHRDLPGDLRLIHDDGWTRFLGRLVEAAAGREAGAYPTGDPAARRAGLEAR